MKITFLLTPLELDMSGNKLKVRYNSRSLYQTPRNEPVELQNVALCFFERNFPGQMTDPRYICYASLELIEKSLQFCLGFKRR